MEINVLLAIIATAVIVSVIVVGIVVAMRGEDKGLLPELQLWNPSAIPFGIIAEEGFGHYLILDFRWAMGYWNDSVGMELFHWDPLQATTLIPLMSGELDGNKAMKANFTLRGDGSIKQASITIDLRKIEALSMFKQRQRAAAHELGHVLGLAHDNIMLSVMFPNLSPTDAPVVTVKDKATLRGVYG